MKKLKSILLVLFCFAFLYTSCSKDDDDSSVSQEEETQDEISNLNGLEDGVEPINTDTLAVYNEANIKILDQEIITNNYEKEYQISVNTTDPSKVKEGSVIVDYTNGGRIWIIKSVASEKSTSTNQKVSQKVGQKELINVVANAVLGTLDVLFKNCIVELSTPSNRSKESSVNTNKLESNKLKIYTATDEDVEFNIPDISIKDKEIIDGVTLSVENNDIIVNLENVNLYSNQSNTFQANIVEGKLIVNNAVDFRAKFTGVNSPLVSTPAQIGVLTDFNSSIYSTIDTNIKLNIESSTNGSLNLVEPIEKEIASYTKLIPIPPYIVASLKVSLKVKFKASTEAELNITPEISTKNNFEYAMEYEGINSIPSIEAKYENVETNLSNTITGDFNLNQRFEIVPEIELYAYGLLGPKGEIIAYQELDVNANLDNSIVTWDSDVDLGIDYGSSIDVSIFHIDDLTQTVYNKYENLFNYDLYDSPSTLEIESGNNQVGLANGELEKSIYFVVKDSKGNTLTGVPVFFEAEQGSFKADYLISDENGVVENNWTLGSSLEIQEAEAFLKDGNGNKIETTITIINASVEGALDVEPAHSPTPSNGQENMSLTGSLSFMPGAGTPANVTYKLYFYPVGSFISVFDIGSEQSYEYSVPFNDTQYVWYVETYSSTGGLLATSPFWNLRTEADVSGGIYEGDVILTTQEEVDEFISHRYDEINGSLSIQGKIFTDLTGLSTITKVNSTLSILNTDLTNLSFLSNLTYCNSLIIENNSSLSNLFDLSMVSEVTALEVEENDMLTSLEGLENLLAEEINYIYINSNPELLSVRGLGYNTISMSNSLRMLSNSKLETFSAFNNLKFIDKRLWVSGSNLERFDGLEKLEEISDTFWITNNSRLLSFDSFSSLYKVGSFTVQQNDLIKDFTGLENLSSSASNITIHFNNSLESLKGLENLETSSGFAITSNENLLSISDLISLNSITGNFIISGNSSLNSLDLPSFNSNSIVSMVISNNNNLENLDGLEGVTRIGKLTISENSMLKNIDGLENIISLSNDGGVLTNSQKDLSIQDNPLLNNLNGLLGINTVEGLDITIKNNSSLVNLCGLKTVFSFDSEVSYNFICSDNGFNPTQEDVLDDNCTSE